MESIGEKLRIARETRDITLEQAARDTHIARHYLSELETENFDAFPGETYLIGFLRSYAKYLELNDNDIVTLYRNIQIQEQPAPIAELLDTKPNRKKVGLAVAGGIIAILIVTAILLVAFGDVPISTPVPEPREPAPVPGVVSDIPRLEQEFLERRFVRGERIAVPIAETTVVLEFVEIGQVVTIGAEVQIVRIGAGEQQSLDLSGDGTPDVRISVRQINAESVPPTAVARLDRVVQSPSGAFTIGATQGVEETELTNLLIAQFNQPEEYFVEADFRGYTMFRYEIDGKERRQDFFQRGDRVRDSVEEKIRLWASNGGNVRLRVAGIPVELGSDGEVVAVEIRWIVDTDGRFNLELFRLD